MSHRTQSTFPVFHLLSDLEVSGLNALAKKLPQAHFELATVKELPHFAVLEPNLFPAGLLDSFKGPSAAPQAQSPELSGIVAAYSRLQSAVPSLKYEDFNPLLRGLATGNRANLERAAPAQDIFEQAHAAMERSKQVQRQLFLENPALVQYLDVALAEAMACARRLHCLSSEQIVFARACAFITADGRVSFGLPLYNGNPPQCLDAEWGASSKLISSGEFPQVIGCYMRTEDPSAHAAWPPLASALISPHIHPALATLPVMVRYAGGSQSYLDHHYTLTRSDYAPTLQGPSLMPIGPRSPGSAEIVFRLPCVYSKRMEHGYSEQQIVQAIFEKLRAGYGLTTTNAEERPARKGHNAAVIAGDLVFTSNNVRHGREFSTVECGEALALTNMCNYFAMQNARHLPHVDAVVVYAQDYISNPHIFPNRPLPANICDSCKSKLSSMTDPNVGEIDVFLGHPEFRDAKGRLGPTRYIIGKLSEQDYAASERALR